MAILCVILQLFTAEGASSFCYEPSAPHAPYSSPPSSPICSPGGDTYNRCTNLEIDSYKDNVEEYIQKLKTYAEAAASYADEVTEYAECQAQGAVDGWNRFIND